MCVGHMGLADDFFWSLTYIEIVAMVEAFYTAEDRRSIGTARLFAQQLNLNRGKDDRRVYDVPDIFPGLAYLFEEEEDEPEPDPAIEARRWMQLAKMTGAVIDPAVFEILKNSNGK